MTEPVAEENRRLTVFLVDDHAMFRAGVRAELGAHVDVVGDTDCDERVAALVAAAREALVNAARHAGVETVSLYAEVESDELSVFVRDRGAGFDPEGVEDTRHGVRGSIVGRMRRHGGRAEIRSAPGDGTEVRLTLPVSRESVTAGKETAR